MIECIESEKEWQHTRFPLSIHVFVLIPREQYGDVVVQTHVVGSLIE